MVKPVWESISIYDGPDVFLEQFAQAPVASRILFAAHWCQSEVRNGGLHQFFSNSTGVLAPEAILAFKEIGLLSLALVVQEASAWFGPIYPREREIRAEVLDTFEKENPEDWDPFTALDKEFFQLLDTENGGFAEAAGRYAARFSN